MNGFSLRDYQHRGSDRVMSEFQEVGSTLVVWPTGCGKTVLFADVIRRMQPLRAMVLAHRKELIWQARERIFETTGLDCQIEMGELSVRPSLFGASPVIISTVQTQCSNDGVRRRMGRFKPEDFGLLIVDEAHRSVSESYQDVIRYYRQNLKLKVLGVTATPDRLDEVALGQIFESVADDYELLDAIEDGWLVSPLQQCVAVKSLDYSHVRTTAGELNGSDLAAVMEAEEVSQQMIQAALECMFAVPAHSLASLPVESWSAFLHEHGHPRRTLVFTVSVNQAEVMSNVFNRVHPGMATWVCGATPEDQRKTIVQDFAAGRFQVVCNCDVFGEGYDNPGIEVVVIARPTKSRAKYCQMVGRGTRPLTGLVDGIETPMLRRDAILNSPKPTLLVVDFVGNSGKHKLVTTADILGGKVSEEAMARAIKVAEKSETPVNMVEVLKQEEEDLKAELEKRRRAEEARKSRLVAKSSYTTRFVNPFDILEISPVKARGWDQGKVLSEKQRALLRKQGVDPDAIPYAQGRQLIAEMFRRWDNKECSFGQAKVLKKYRLPIRVGRDQASKWIDAIARNNWQRPSDLAVPEAEKNAVPF